MLPSLWQSALPPYFQNYGSVSVSVLFSMHSLYNGNTLFYEKIKADPNSLISYKGWIYDKS